MSAPASSLAARARYLADQVSTASPAALIVMLYDRLSLDLEVAFTALDSPDPEDPLAAATALAHGQRVVTELLSSLDPSVWSGGDDLAALYRYILLGLIETRTAPNRAKLRSLATIVGDLRGAWATAAATLAGVDPAASGTQFAGVG